MLLLFGRWEVFRAPRPGRPRRARSRRMRGNPERRCHLVLRAVALIGPRAWRTVPIRSPGGYNPTGPVAYKLDLDALSGQPDMPRNVAFDLSDGTIWRNTAELPSDSVIPAYLVLLLLPCSTTRRRHSSV